MTIWLERFALAILAIILGATVLTNPWNLNRIQQLALVVAIVAMSVFAARTVERLREPTATVVSERVPNLDAPTTLGGTKGSETDSATPESRAGMTDSNAKREFSGGAQSTPGISQTQHEEGASPTSHTATPAAATRSSPSDNFMESGIGPTVQPRIAIEPPLAIDVSSGFSSPAFAARIAFDYSKNDGRFTIGQGEMTFITSWSKASNTSIHAYKDAPRMQSLSLASGLKEIDSIDDASSFDASSRV